jgi:PPM family protein phosphatase
MPLDDDFDVLARRRPGRERADNQDSFLVDPRLRLAVLCDGMGGHAAGARASTLAARVFRQAILAGKALIRAYIDHACPEPVTKSMISDLLREAAAAASRAVYEDATRHVQRAGMGTTLIACSCWTTTPSSSTWAMAEPNC